MSKIRYTDFETAGDVLKSLNLKPGVDEEEIGNTLNAIWAESVGEKIAQYTKTEKILPDGTVIVLCADACISNELYLSKSKILEIFDKNLQNSGIKITDIKFNWKKWKDKKDEAKE